MSSRVNFMPRPQRVRRESIVETPFKSKSGLAYGGTVSTKKISRDELSQMLEQTDSRTIKQVPDQYF